MAHNSASLCMADMQGFTGEIFVTGLFLCEFNVEGNNGLWCIFIRFQYYFLKNTQVDLEFRAI